jgi:general secretion pathway protein J
MKLLRAHRQWTHGFTLIELLVVMTMVSLIALSMAGAMRTMAQTEARVDERLLRADDFRVASDFVRRTLGRVSMRRVEPPPPLGENLFAFVAQTSSLSWVGVMPARHGAGGRTAFRLAAEGQPGAQDLVIRFAPLGDINAFPEWSTAQSRVLAKDVTEFVIAYQDARQTPSQWIPQWNVPNRLPSRVKLTVQTKAGGWPDVVVVLRPLPSTSASEGATFGGGSGDSL